MNELQTFAPAGGRITQPAHALLAQERIPHIWCPGCGIGTALNCFIRALMEAALNRDKVASVSGIGCSGRVAGY